MNKDKEMYFIYSEMEYDHNVERMKSIGKTFRCGQVSTNDKVQQFTNIIDPDILYITLKTYPDLKIVAKGILSKMSYTDVSRD